MGAMMGGLQESHNNLYISMTYGGQGGIRTHDTLAGMPHFECGAIDHSTTCPPAVIREAGRQGKVFSCP
jgi:hypothetical protein